MGRPHRQLSREGLNLEKRRLVGSGDQDLVGRAFVPASEVQATDDTVAVKVGQTVRCSLGPQWQIR